MGMTSDLGLNVIRGEEWSNPRSEAQEIPIGKVLVLYHGKVKQNIANLRVV
jgi:signal recognition particle subunit SEC65